MYSTYTSDLKKHLHFGQNGKRSVVDSSINHKDGRCSSGKLNEIQL